MGYRSTKRGLSTGDAIALELRRSRKVTPASPSTETGVSTLVRVVTA
jgi:hypothetical protein